MEKQGIKEKKTKKKEMGSPERNNSKSLSSRQRVFVANHVGVYTDNASLLIGRILEKGISDDLQKKPSNPTPPPKLSVLPFPVARHRSHGPHWDPMSNRMGGDASNEDDRDNVEYDDPANFDQISVFANPVPRKHKKGLDLSKWKELVPSEKTCKGKEDRLHLKDINKQKKKDIQYHCSPTNQVPMEVDFKTTLSSVVPPSEKKEVVSNDIDVQSQKSTIDMEIDNPHQLLEITEDINSKKISSTDASEVLEEMDKMDSKLWSSKKISRDAASEVLEEVDKMDSELWEMRKKQEQRTFDMASASRFNGFGNEQRFMSLESEIDAENRARLQSMSSEEIAEAQAEIAEKLNPALLKLLTKRGQKKSKQQNLSRSDGINTGEMTSILRVKDFEKEYDVSVHPNGDTSGTMTGTLNDVKSGLDNRAVQSPVQGKDSLWNNWTERVEAVRGLRFSLEGNIIEAESKPGNLSIDDRLKTGSVAERDILRNEGDPGASGYTIKEAIDLTRSVIPGQRALALHLLASVLDNAMHGIHQNQVGCTMQKAIQIDKSVDWEAIWAFALGPEPDLGLCLRMCLDDNHNSVVLACAKVIQCALSFNFNESFFESFENITTCEKDIFTAPVFRSKPGIDPGFLHGGFWKYSAKPSNILTFSDDMIADETERNPTIQDDVVVASQDFAAGLVRMGILPRLRYLLEAGSSTSLEECIISVLIAIARHSPTCTDAIMKCQGLLPAIVRQFTEDRNDINPLKIKSVRLLKVLAQTDKKICIELIKDGSFQAMTRHLYQGTYPLDHWIRLGKENCKLSAALMVEQLRFWKVCMYYGCCISYFPDIFPALCLWLTPPTFEKLEANNVLGEFASISKECYLVLEALATKLPNFYMQESHEDDNSNFPSDFQHNWSWSYVMPMVDLAVRWIVSKKDVGISKVFEWKNEFPRDLNFQNFLVSSLLWVYSAVFRMLLAILEAVNPEDAISHQGSAQHVTWLSDFVLKIGLEMIRNGFLSFVDHRKHSAEGGSFVEELCHLRRQGQYETSLASACCLHELLRLVTKVDYVVSLVRGGIPGPLQGGNSSGDLKVLLDGILHSSRAEWLSVLNVFMNFVASEWKMVQSIETFGRGGPAPGLGVGWGAAGGGFWSMTVLSAQTDAGLLSHMLKIFGLVSTRESQFQEEMMPDVDKINTVLEICLSIGPRDRVTVENAFDLLLQLPVFMFFDFCIRHFLQLNKRMKLFHWEYKKEDYLHFSKILASHFKIRWLSMKTKSKAVDDGNSYANRASEKGSISLDTIHESLDASSIPGRGHYCSTLTAEWAYQRLPLPVHWFLSPISSISNSKNTGMRGPSDMLEVAKGGLFFLLGLETMSTFIPCDSPSPVRNVHLVWKLHSLSVILLFGMDVLEDDKSRNSFETLQDLYGQQLEQERFKSPNILHGTGNKSHVESLRFQSVINESYATFLETLVEQFAAVSYGDLVFGRQVALYVNRATETAVRLAAWNALSNARVLDILPPLEKCFSEAEGYLEPIEDNEGILEAYVKSWVSDALDRAARRGTMAFALVLHHLSSFIFLFHPNDKVSLRNKLVRSLLRDYSQKQKHEGMMLDFVGYNKPSTSHLDGEQQCLCLESCNMEKRFAVLVEACEGNSSLLVQVDKLKSAFAN
ncbi:hypothetical protein K2173_010499 [Erythroxylum novogranatense]|uniref:Uncharacterized protein n=1 Tax=Erythroxylum novogranatense TaxID=1862640 RepID=A0AAV8TDZ8_9ROSI|nr:hypothetical protein K2173_010499 [Erythroxylum novogranatense]